MDFPNMRLLEGEPRPSDGMAWLIWFRSLQGGSRQQAQEALARRKKQLWYAIPVPIETAGKPSADDAQFLDRRDLPEGYAHYLDKTGATAAGLKYDNGKPPMSLLDRHALESIATVLAFGAEKYAAHNWRAGIAYSRLLDAALRHLFAFADGEDNDSESGLSHIAHAGCCVVFLLGMTNTRPDLDDRHKPAAGEPA